MNGWEKTLHEASTLLLKQLKHYHRTMVFQVIHKFASEIYQHHHLKKKKKLSRLQKPSNKWRNCYKRSVVQNCPSSPKQDSGKTVVNLSGNKLSPSEISVLSKGMSFCPYHQESKVSNSNKTWPALYAGSDWNNISFAKTMMIMNTHPSARGRIGHPILRGIWP